MCPLFVILQAVLVPRQPALLLTQKTEWDYFVLMESDIDISKNEDRYEINAICDFTVVGLELDGGMNL